MFKNWTDHETMSNLHRLTTNHTKLGNVLIHAIAIPMLSYSIFKPLHLYLPLIVPVILTSILCYSYFLFHKKIAVVTYLWMLIQHCFLYFNLLNNSEGILSVIYYFVMGVIVSHCLLFIGHWYEGNFRIVFIKEKPC